MTVFKYQNFIRPEGSPRVVQVSDAVRRLSGSQRSNKLSRPAAGKVISLASGDPSFTTPDYITEAAIRAIRDGHTHYAPPMGLAGLRQVIADDLSTLGGGQFLPEHVLVTNGASSGIYACMLAYLNPGDEVLLHDPTYSLYCDVALSAGAVPVFVPWTPALRPDMEALERAVTPRTRMFVLNNPVNPTGIVMTPEEMQAIADFVVRHDLLLVADEAYDHLVFDGRPMTSAASFEALAERAVVINTCSKTFAMTGWRVGYAAARGGLVKGVGVIHRTIVNNINSISQHAALAAYSVQTGWQDSMLAEYTRRRELMCDMVNAMPGLRCEKPEGAFYVFVQVEGSMSSGQLTDHCLAHGVAVRSGTEFGPRGEGYIRLTFAGEVGTFKPGLERLDQAMRALRP